MSSLNSIKGVGEKTITLLNKIGIYSKIDLINYYPYRYNVIKRSNINELKQDDKIIIDGVVESLPSIFYYNRKMDKMNFKINIGSKIINIIIFNRGFLKNKILLGSNITIIGKYDIKHNTIIGNDIRFESIGNKVVIEPIYHTINNLSNNNLKKYINEIINEDFNVIDYIPENLNNKYHFMSKINTLRIIHNPKNIEELKLARLKLKYEELFKFTLKINYLKTNKINREGLERIIDYKLVEDFINKLPFKLTSDQLNSVKDIYNDLVDKKRMNRLLQGDVGSGKTIVSFIAIYINYLSGYQSALMAPTEILAIQHYNNLNELLSNYNINVKLLTGKTSLKEKKQIYQDLENGVIDIIIGTHALISDNVVYKNLGLVITDEQHRFGVNQRDNLKNKGITPDVLYMSATPIPRTYALTLYGEMDISSIKTRPSGRKDVITILKSTTEIKDVLMSMYKELKNNHQIYVISPLVEENESVNLEDVYDLENKMNKAFGKLYKIGVLHGKMINEEKDKVMTSFKNNEIQILISTTVIEVGIDVSNATMIVIFDSYRFGLSQLHQLRGRVGRNKLDSYCILISDKETERLNILTKTSDGFQISEEDFKLRGSGDLFGIRQSGDMRFKIADLKKDFNILVKAKDDSLEYLKNNSDSIIVSKIINELD